MRHLLSALVLIIAAAPFPVSAQEWAGYYRWDAGPDSVGGLELSSDGSFRFGVSAGALDTHAAGSWTRTGDNITLRTEPRPVAPVFALAGAEADEGDGTLGLKVTWPNGSGVPGIDFRIHRDGADTIEGYTQPYGWQSEPGQGYRVISIQLAEPIHGIVSPMFDVPMDARHFTFILTPNDMGVADFDNAPAHLTADGLTLHWRGGQLSFTRAAD